MLKGRVEHMRAKESATAEHVLCKKIKEARITSHMSVRYNCFSHIGFGCRPPLVLFITEGKGHANKFEIFSGDYCWKYERCLFTGGNSLISLETAS